VKIVRPPGADAVCETVLIIISKKLTLAVVLVDEFLIGMQTYKGLPETVAWKIMSSASALLELYW
jgi:hypothetical protein